MLNRRFLRIKAFQRVYAHYISIDAYQESALSGIEATMKKHFNTDAREVKYLEEKEKKTLEILEEKRLTDPSGYISRKRFPSNPSRTIPEKKHGSDPSKHIPGEKYSSGPSGYIPGKTPSKFNQGYDSTFETGEEELESYSHEEKQEEEQQVEKQDQALLIKRLQTYFLAHQDQLHTRIDHTTVEQLGVKVEEKEVDRVVELLQNTIESYQRAIANNNLQQVKALRSVHQNLNAVCFRLISLLVEIKLLYQEQIAEGKHVSGAEYVKLSIPSFFEKNKKFQQARAKHDINWHLKKTLIRRLCKSIFESQLWNAFIISETKDIDHEIELITSILRDIICEDESVIPLLETWDETWEEDKKVVRKVIKRMLKSVDFKEQDVELPVISSDGDENKIFLQYLYTRTLQESENCGILLQEHVEHWDLERIAKVDLIILKMALTEVLHCENIPVKVTIEEYIEIAKKYSTLESSVFINGVLGGVIEKLSAEGKIKKTGRGLMDNK